MPISIPTGSSWHFQVTQGVSICKVGPRGTSSKENVEPQGWCQQSHYHQRHQKIQARNKRVKQIRTP